MQIILSQLAKDLAGDTRLTNRSDAWLKGLDDAFTGRGYTPP